MARTIAEIYAEIVAHKDSQAALNGLAPTADNLPDLADDLSSNSRVAIWRLWAYTTAVGIYTHEVLWDIFKKEVETIAANAITGTLRWYQEQVLLFQFGDLLTYDSNTGKYGYSTIDPTKRIVNRCAVIETAQGLVIKAAHETGGVVSGLSLAEATALSGYVRKIRFAGTRVQVISGNGDILKVSATIYYDPIVPLATVKADVKAAIQNYVANLDYNGELVVNNLIDKVQQVSGVQDVQVAQAQTKPNSSFGWHTIVRAHVAVYGYYTISTTTGEQLDDTLTYVPL